MSEPLVVAFALEPAATRVTLWSGGAQRFDERITHGALALAGTFGLTTDARQRVRADAVRALLTAYGEDALRPDAFVALGGGATRAGVYAAAAAPDDASSEAASLALTLAAESGTRALVVEPIGQGDAAAGELLHAERVLLARAVVRRDAFDAPGTMDAARIIISLEERTLALAFDGERIAAVLPSDVTLHADSAERLIRRMELGDPTAASMIAAFAESAARACRDALRAVQDACAIVLSGSLAQHAGITGDLARELGTSVPVRIMPAERVERALAELASAALVGLEPVRAYG